MKLFKYLAAQVFLLLFALSATVQVCRAAEWIRITDLVGRSVSVPQNPVRIIGLGPGTLRLIIYLEGKNKVVGVEDIEKQFPATRPYWIAHSDLGRLPSIGPGGPASIGKEPDLEKILALKPDLIFISYMEREKAEALQKKIGIPVCVLTYGQFANFDERVYDSLRLCGRILNKTERAEAVIRFIEQERKELLKRVEGFPENQKPLVYVGGIGFRGTQGLESTETAYAPVEWVKAVQAAKKAGLKGHQFVDREKLLAWNPEIIFLDSGGIENIRQDFLKKPSFYQGLTAFKNKKVFLLYAFNWYVTNIETVIIDAFAVGKTLYPDRFRDIRLDKKADEIYTFFLGRPLFREMEKHQGKLLGVPEYLQ
ncbi:MAG: iron ABC transporter substrate-binding protein [Thermodesulfobacteriota bacterium]